MPHGLFVSVSALEEPFPPGGHAVSLRGICLLPLQCHRNVDARQRRRELGKEACQLAALGSMPKSASSMSPMLIASNLAFESFLVCTKLGLPLEHSLMRD